MFLSEKKRGRPAGKAAKKTNRTAAVKKGRRKTGSVKRTVTTSLTGITKSGQVTKVLRAQHKRELAAERSKTLGLQKALKSAHQAIAKALGGAKTTKKAGSKHRGRPKA